MAKLIVEGAHVHSPTHLLLKSLGWTHIGGTTYGGHDYIHNDHGKINLTFHHFKHRNKDGVSVKSDSEQNLKNYVSNL